MTNADRASQASSVMVQGPERELLTWAMEGDRHAAEQIILYLSSANPYLRQVMLDTLHRCTEECVWQRLLRCAAQECWSGRQLSGRLGQRETAWQFDDSLLAAFTEDRSEAERRAKVRALEKALEDIDLCINQSAAYLLGMRRDPRAIPALADALTRAGRGMQVRAIRALAEIGDGRCASILMQALAADRDILHHEAGWALGKLGEAARPVLMMALDHPDEHIRWHAARFLAELGDARAADVLADGLCHANAAIRRASVQALGYLDARAVPAILALWGRSTLDEPSRQAACQALFAMQVPATRHRLQPLLEALHGIATRDRAAAVARRLLVNWPLE